MAQDKKVVAEAAPIVKKEDDLNRQKALELALAHIEKQFGKGSIMRLSSDIKVDVPAIPTGALSLDLALGIGGLPGEEWLRFLARSHPVKLPLP